MAFHTRRRPSWAPCARRIVKSLAFGEELISQIPALRLLMALGYDYLTPEEALALRCNSERRVLPVMAPFVTGELRDE